MRVKKKKKFEKHIIKPTAIENALYFVPGLEVIQFEMSSLGFCFFFFKVSNAWLDYL